MSRSVLSSRPLQLALVAALTLAFGAGCVSRRKYDAMVRERDVYRAQEETLTAETEELTDVAAQLEEELTLRDSEIVSLEETQRQLADELDVLVVAGLVKMKLLRDGLHLVLSEEVLFASGSAELRDSGRELILDMVDEFQAFPYQIGVLGYTDNVPVGRRLAAKFPSNWELAAARAAAVVRTMESGGINSEQLVVVSFGPNRPYTSNATPEGRAENRRIEIRLRPVTPPTP